MQVSVEEVEGESEEGDGEGKTGIGLGGGGEEESERIDEGAVDVVEEIEGDDDEGERVRRVAAERVEENSEPKGRAFHEEPSEGWGESGAPARAGVLAVWGCEEVEGEDGEWAHDV